MMVVLIALLVAQGNGIRVPWPCWVLMALWAAARIVAVILVGNRDEEEIEP